MTSSLLGAALAMVRGWTRIYTWRLPPALRDARRAEIESDLWEFRRDARQRLSPAVHVIVRLALGIPDDIQWRMTHASLVNSAVMIVVAVTTTAFLVAALWVVDVLRARKLPVPPPQHLVLPAPPVAPRPSAHLKPRVREERFYDHNAIGDPRSVVRSARWPGHRCRPGSSEFITTPGCCGGAGNTNSGGFPIA